MRRTTIALMLACAPGYLAAQTQPGGQTESKPASQSQATSGFSAETRVRLEAMLRVARESDLPTGPMTSVIAEGQAKGASEAQIIAATQQVEAELAASQQALIRAGRPQPSDAQVERGARVLASGATSAQLEAFARHAPSERRLEVAFQVLTDLAARGVPVAQALAVIGAQLSGGASEGQLVSLTASANGQANGQASAGNAPPGSAVAVGSSLTAGLGVGLTKKP
jgi:hypothetical protein